jgi:hypothetical protein
VEKCVIAKINRGEMKRKSSNSYDPVFLWGSFGARRLHSTACDMTDTNLGGLPYLKEAFSMMDQACENKKECST